MRISSSIFGRDVHLTLLNYPSTPTVDQVNDYHGTPVADPYRWLEDVDSPETLAWVKAQNELTFSFLEGIPAREKIRRRLTELWDYPRFSAPLKKGGRYFQLRNTGLQNQDALYALEALDGEARLLLDPNTLSADGTVALNTWSVSKDGRWLAYAISASGSDWLTWRVRDVMSGEDLTDLIEWSKFSGAAWLPDGSGFFYSRYNPPLEGQAYEGVNYNQKLCFHRLGDSQTEDRLVYERPDQKEWGFDGNASEDGRYLVVHVWQGTDTRNRVFYRDLQHAGAIVEPQTSEVSQTSEVLPFVELIDTLEADYTFVGNDRPVFYFRTDLDAPRGRLIAIDTSQPQRENWKTLIPESRDVLEMVKMVSDQFVALYLHDAHHQLKQFDLGGAFLGEISLPAPGSILALNGEYSLNGSREDDELFYAFQSFVHPPTVHRYDFGWSPDIGLPGLPTDEDDRSASLDASLASEDTNWSRNEKLLAQFRNRASEVVEAANIAFDFGPYRTRQVFVTGKDGTRVPMFLVHKQDLVKDGHQPTLLYGYGGFNIPLVPSFMVSRLIWLELGGVLAVVNLRGGGEYGEEWHKAGSLHNKQNVFDDFIACAEYLIAEGITSSPKLAIEGRSNGGLLVGACITQRPELFGAALPAVGVMDMLRFHKFTIGWAWVSDYGSSEDPDGFNTLYAYSPLHNLKPGTRYPATLVTTADHDDRVVPGHSFKFAAALQAAQAGEAPVLIRIQTKAGHGFGKPTSILIEEQADIWAFLVKALKLENETVKN